MKYPIEITGKVLAIAPQLYVRDADGVLILYVKQKLLAFKEKVNLFRDEKQTDLALSIKADRVIDFSANYSIYNAQGQAVGALRRKGMRSIWRASYEITQGNEVVATITELKPWVKVIDSILGQLPIIGVIISMMINPSYILKNAKDHEVYRIEKRVSFLERKFTIHREGRPEGLETLFIPAILMMVLLEDNRG
jgi:uncharacterized protein YxjI